MNLDLVSFTATAPGTGSAMTVVSGDASNILNGLANKEITAVGMWTKSQAVGTTQLIWPSGHDLVRGIRYRNLANDPINKQAFGMPARFRAQDPLTVTQVGSAVAGDVELFHLLLHYEDLPGIDARLMNLAAVRKAARNTLTIENTITATAASTYSAAQALNAGSDLLKANTNYALLGAVIGATCGALTVRGPDTGNRRVAIPGGTDPLQSADWFVQLGEAYGVPCIPVFNSANRAGTFIEVVQDENLTAVPFCLNLVELAN